MRLYLLRHGHAPSITDAKVARDAERPLSEEGREAVRRSVRLMLEKGAKPAIVLHSPLRRAVETAQEAALLLKPAQGTEAFAPLSNAMPAEELLEALRRKLPPGAEALAVGHQPQLGELAALITGQILELRPGGVIALEAGDEPKTLWAKNP